MPIPRNTTNEFIANVEYKHYDFDEYDDEYDLDNLEEINSNYTLPDNAAEIIANNTRLTDDMMRRITNLFCNNETAHNRIECAELIADYLKENTEFTTSTIYEFMDILEPVYGDFQCAGDLDDYVMVCCALTNEL